MVTRRILALVLAATVSLSAAPAFGASALTKKPTPTTIPTLHSSTGHIYRVGEFRPAADLNKLDHGSDGIIKCLRVKGYDRWVKD